MGADSSAENPPNASEFICPSPKVLDFNEKSLHWMSVVLDMSEVTSKWFYIKNLICVAMIFRLISRIWKKNYQTILVHKSWLFFTDNRLQLFCLDFIHIGVAFRTKIPKLILPTVYTVVQNWLTIESASAWECNFPQFLCSSPIESNRRRTG